MSLSRTRNLFNGRESPSSLVGRGRHRSLALLLLFVVVGRNEAAGQEGYSIIRLEPGGPGGPVTGLCFAPDSKVLYVAGWSKTVQVWDRNEATGLLDQNRQATLRVPLGLGVDGVINAMALSADGQWLAVGGQGVIADAAGFFRQGYTVPYDLLPDEMKMDRGQITVFRTSQPAQVRRLRGHLDSILALAFASVVKERPCVLASISLNNVDQEIELVLNVWDVDREKSLMPEFKSSSLGRFKRGSIPLTQLVARRGGEDLRDIEVAYALGDDKLRVWNSAKHEVEKYSSDYQIYALAWLDEQRLVTAGQWNDAISLQFWARANPKECFKKSNRDGWHLHPYETPQALAILSREKGSKRAVILLQGRQKRKGLVEAIYRIQVAKLGEDLSCQWLDSMELGSVPNEGPYLPPPVLCISPDESKLAVAYGRGHEVRIYDLGEAGHDLARLPEPQVLKRRGRRFQEAFFVYHRNRKEGVNWKGLMLSDSHGNKWVIDLKNRQLSEKTDEWERPREDPPREGGWDIVHKDEQRRSLAIRRPDKTELELKLSDLDYYTAHALLPSGKDHRPVVAVAGLEGRAPLLCLYDGASGEMIQWLEGHSEMIRRLEFSPDGKWLVSTSDDRTVCLWRIEDVEKAGRRRRIEGVYTDTPEADGGRKVLAVNPRGVNGQAKRFEPGDRIVGISRDGQDLHFTKPEDLLKETQGIEGPVTVLIRRGQNPEQRVDGVSLEKDPERIRPDLSLFFLESKPGGDRALSWIAWTADGDYDFVGDQTIEDLLGWHDNPPTRGGPMPSYQRIDENRGKRNTGLLPSLNE